MLDKKNVKPAKTRAKDPGKRKIGKVIRKQPATKRKEDSGNLPDIVPKEESLSKKKTPGLTIMSDQKRILDNILHIYIVDEVIKDIPHIDKIQL